MLTVIKGAYIDRQQTVGIVFLGFLGHIDRECVHSVDGRAFVVDNHR